MRATPTRWPWVSLAAAVLLLVGACGPCKAWGNDLVTLSGPVYHNVEVVRVDPDGVTWRHDEGICKVSFDDCPESVRKAYHYDPAKAQAYRAAQAEARQKADEQTREILKASDERRVARAQATMAERTTHSGAEADLAFRRATSPAASAATRALGQQMDDAAARKAAEPTGALGVLANSRVGHILSGMGLVGFGPSDGPALLNFGPAGPPPNSAETKLSAHHAAGTANPTDAAHDAFYTPDYQTKSYYDDVDRAESYSRGVPLKLP